MFVKMRVRGHPQKPQKKEGAKTNSNYPLCDKRFVMTSSPLSSLLLCITLLSVHSFFLPPSVPASGLSLSSYSATRVRSPLTYPYFKVSITGLYGSRKIDGAIDTHGPWSSYLDVSNGVVYYFNEETGESKWEDPTRDKLFTNNGTNDDNNNNNNKVMNIFDNPFGNILKKEKDKTAAKAKTKTKTKTKTKEETSKAVKTTTSSDAASPPSPPVYTGEKRKRRETSLHVWFTRVYPYLT